MADESAEELAIEPTPAADEAAAIAVAIGVQLEAEAAVAAEAAGDRSPSWEGRRWGFAGRLRSIGRPVDRIPRSSPEDAWTAAGRSERF